MEVFFRKGYNKFKQSTGRLNDGMDDKMIDEKEVVRYGWRHIRPQCLQWLNTPVWFLVFTCLASVAQSMCINGLLGVTISTLEKRFDMSSKQASAIASSYEFAGIPALMIIGFIGATWNRPRLISSGMFLVSIGSLLFAIPHYTTGYYEYRDVTVDNTCHMGDNSTSICEAGETVKSLSSYLYLFIFNTIVIAFGSAPLYLLTVTYIDDSLPRGQSSIYLGIFHGMGVIGPAIAYIGGGFLLKVYTDMDRHSQVELTPDDPRWVGAWWVGFLVTWILSLLTVLPLSGFPKHMVTADSDTESKTAEIYDSGDAHLTSKAGFGTTLKELPLVLKTLCMNPTFMFSTMVGVCDAAIINGFSNFGPKYIENQFSISAGLAGMVFGAIAIPGGAGGSFAGSFIIKRFNLSCVQCVKGMFYLCISVMVFAVMFFIKCDNAKFVGVNYNNHSNNLASEVGKLESLTQACNTDCDCDHVLYEPVCGSDKLTYFSPCMAGCTDITFDNGKVFHNCTCLEDTTSTAQDGICSVPNCTLMPLFIIIMFLAMFCIFVTIMLHVQVLLRCVPQGKRSLALGIDWTLGRALGSVPGTVLFGAFLDESCILWQEKCDGKGSCLYYDNRTMAWYMLAICAVAKTLSVIFALLAWKLYKNKGDSTSVSRSVSQCPSSAQIVGNGMNELNDVPNGRLNQGFKEAELIVNQNNNEEGQPISHNDINVSEV